MSKLPEWVQELVDKRVKMETCIALWKEVTAFERQDRMDKRAEQDAKFDQMVKTRELDRGEGKGIEI